MSINPIRFVAIFTSCIRGQTENRPPFDGEVRGVDERTQTAALSALGSHWRGKPLQEVLTRYGIDFQTGEKINHDPKN